MKTDDKKLKDKTPEDLEDFQTGKYKIKTLNENISTNKKEISKSLRRISGLKVSTGGLCLLS